MKIEELIELLQEEQRLHPHAEVEVKNPYWEDSEEIKGMDFDGQEVIIMLNPSI